MTLRSTWFALPLVALGGCSIVVDADSYRLDRGCDLNLDLAGFDGPHMGLSTFVQVDAPDPDAASGLRLAGLVRVDGIPSGVMQLRIPVGVPTESSVLDFYVDNNNPTPEGIYNVVSSSGSGRGDHSWTIAAPCGETYNAFTHRGTFDDFPITVGLDEPLVFELQGFDIAGDNVEIRVLHYDENLDAVDGTGDGRYTRAFLHATSQTSTDPGTGPVLVLNPLRDMLDRGVAFDVELFIDLNGDQVVNDSTTTNDPNDEGFVYHFAVPGSVGAGQIAIPTTGNIVLSRAVAGSDDHSGTVGLRVAP